MLGMMTAVTEVTRNASTASRGLNMISSRLVQVLDESSSTGKKLTKIYNDLGIALKDDTGQMRSTYDILKDLAGQWNTLSGDQQKYIALTSAGARQTQNFVALMENFGTAIDATATAYNSAGSAARENERVLDSISKKLEILRSEFQQLVIGDGGLQEFVKNILDIGIALLKFANSDVGQVILKTTAFITVLGLLNKGFNSVIMHMASMVLASQGLTAAEIETTLASKGLSGALNLVKTSMLETTAAFLTSPFGIVLILLTACTAAAIASAKAMEDYANRLNDANDKLNETVDTIKDTESELDNLKNSLKSVGDQIDANNKKKLEFKDNEKYIELLNLENQKLLDKTKEIELQIALKERELEIQKELAEEEAKTVLNTTTESQFKRQDVIDSFSGASTGETRGIQVTPEQELQLAIDKYKELKETAKELNAQLEKTDPQTQEWKDLNAQLDSTNAEMTTVSQRGAEMANIVTNAMSNIGSMADDEKAKLSGLVNQFLQLDDASEAFRRSLKMRLDELGEGGQVNLNLRPVIDAEELNKAGYEAAEGIATVFSHTFSNAAGDIAVNFTPIMVDPDTGEYLGVMEKSAFEQYCQDVVDGVREDDLNLQIGAKFEGEDAVERAEEAAEEIHEIHETLSEDSAKYQQELDEEADSMEDLGDETENLSKDLKNLISSLGITETELEGLKRDFGDNEEELNKYLTSLANVRKALSDTSTVIDNLQGALDTASTALEEYNQNGYLTIDTFQSLMGISAQYLTALVNENGQLEINQSTLGNLVEQLKIAKIQELQNAAAMEIAAWHTEDAGTASANAVGSVSSIGNTIQTTGNQAATAAGQVAIFATEVKKLSGIGDGDMTAKDKQIINKYKKLAQEIANIEVNTTKAGNAATKAGKKGSGAAKQAKDATKELNKELEETKSKYEKVISWISKQYDKEIDKIKKAKDEAVDAEKEKIKAKEKEKDSALDAIEAEIKALEREKNALKEQKEALDARKNALKDEEDTIVKGIEKRIKALEKERDALIKPVEERIKALEKERDAIIDSTQTEIDAINELKEKRQTYWDDQINALKEANKELKDNLELQEKLDALQKAKSTKVKVYKEGQGFVYDVDQNAVQQAQKALDEYLSQKAYEDELARLEALKDAEIKSYNDRLKELNNYKDETKKIYDQQIEDLKNYKDNLKENYTEQIDSLKEYKEAVQEQFEEQIELINQDIDALEAHMDELDKHKDALEEHKDAVEQAYEAEIDALEQHKDEIERAYDAEIQTWENYKQEFEDMVNAYEEQQNRLLFEQLTGIKDESNNWMTRLDNLAEFVRKYNELQAQLDTGNTDVSNNASMKEGSAPSSSYSNGYTSSSGRTVTNNNTSTNRLGGDAQYTPSYNSSGSGRYGAQPTFSTAALINARNRAANRHANGIGSVGQNEIAVVGDSPNQELVIGSKLNGSLMSLEKGTGVVNADSSTTLAGMLNQVGKYGSSGFGSGGGTLNNNYNNDSLTINGVTIQGANISNPETFVNGLLNLKAEALQRAYGHK